jgi:large subunit ribosomal protein L21
MYAVVETGGKQEKVFVGDVFRTEKVDAPVGDVVELTGVRLLVKDDAIIAAPSDLANAKVICEVVGQDRAKKVVVFKRKRKNNYMRKMGHRQFYTSLRVNEIVG